MVGLGAAGIVSRDAVIAGFLRAAGYGAAKVALLAQDASFRRYLRVSGGARPAVLMDAPPPHEDVRPFARVQAVFAASGVSVPEILARSDGEGLLLLEDFGDALYPAVLDDGNRDELYDVATDALGVLQNTPAPAGLPRWTADEMAGKTAETFLDWWWPAMFGSPPDDGIRSEFAVAMHATLKPIDRLPLCVAHRDYFAGNLFWLPDRDGVRRVGIIDFQDAALSSPAYDLVSLVQDARRDVPVTVMARGIRRLLAARPDLKRSDFGAAFAVCAAQRHLRVAALWVRLARRDGKPDYLRHGPRCWALLDQALAHSATAPLAGFLRRHVPRARRRNPDV